MAATRELRCLLSLKAAQIVVDERGFLDYSIKFKAYGVDEKAKRFLAKNK